MLYPSPLGCKAQGLFLTNEDPEEVGTRPKEQGKVLSVLSELPTAPEYPGTQGSGLSGFSVPSIPRVGTVLTPSP